MNNFMQISGYVSQNGDFSGDLLDPIGTMNVEEAIGVQRFAEGVYFLRWRAFAETPAVTCSIKKRSCDYMGFSSSPGSEKPVEKILLSISDLSVHGCHVAARSESDGRLKDVSFSFALFGKKASV